MADITIYDYKNAPASEPNLLLTADMVNWTPIRQEESFVCRLYVTQECFLSRLLQRTNLTLSDEQQALKGWNQTILTPLIRSLFNSPADKMELEYRLVCDRLSSYGVEHALHWNTVPDWFPAIVAALRRACQTPQYVAWWSSAGPEPTLALLPKDGPWVGERACVAPRRLLPDASLLWELHRAAGPQVRSIMDPPALLPKRESKIPPANPPKRGVQEAQEVDLMQEEAAAMAWQQALSLLTKNQPDVVQRSVGAEQIDMLKVLSRSLVQENLVLTTQDINLIITMLKQNSRAKQPGQQDAVSGKTKREQVKILEPVFIVDPEPEDD